MGVLGPPRLKLFLTDFVKLVVPKIFEEILLEVLRVVEELYEYFGGFQAS